PDHAGLIVAEILEGHGLRELHRLDILAAVMAVDNAFGIHDFVKGNAVLIIATVRTMHHEAPDAAGAELECAGGGGGETVRPPPLRQMFRIGPGLPHQLARRVEHARSDDRTRVFDAPRELVWQAWTDPKHLAQWWGPNGFTTTT